MLDLRDGKYSGRQLCPALEKSRISQNAKENESAIRNKLIGLLQRKNRPICTKFVGPLFQQSICEKASPHQSPHRNYRYRMKGSMSYPSVKCKIIP